MRPIDLWKKKASQLIDKIGRTQYDLSKVKPFCTGLYCCDAVDIYLNGIKYIERMKHSLYTIIKKLSELKKIENETRCL
jgi:hypothetical protein